MTGPVFLSYVSEDSAAVDLLQADLESAGFGVWRASTDLAPGDDWRAAIRTAISDQAVVFLACFSRTGLAKKVTYQRDELAFAIDQLRQRSPEVPWLIPVRFDDCEIPDWDLGAGRTLRWLQYVDVFGGDRDAGISKLTASIERAAEPGPAVVAPKRRRRSWIIAAAVVLGAAVIGSAVAAAHGGSGPSVLSIQGRPWMATRLGVVKRIVTFGDSVRLAFEVNNPTGHSISARVRFEAYWGTNDEPAVNIYNALVARTVPPGRSTVYSRLVSVSELAVPGSYSEQTDISDINNSADHTGQYGAFSVAGRDDLGIPFLGLPGRFQADAAYDAAACVAMVLSSYADASRPTVGSVRGFIAKVTGGALESALQHYGVPETAITQVALGRSDLPQAQLTAFATAVRRHSSVIAFVDGADLSSADSTSRNLTGRWVVVDGFGFSAAKGAEVVLDDPDHGPTPDSNAPQVVSLASFERAVADAASLPETQREPDHIAGIIVAPHRQ